MVAGVRSICTECTDTFTSGNLLSTEYSTFTCQTFNSSLVQFRGLFYGYSLTDDAPLLLAIYQWVTIKPFINVFGDQLQVGINCSDFNITASRSSSALLPSITNDNPNGNAGLSSGAIGGIVAAIIVLFAGAVVSVVAVVVVFIIYKSSLTSTAETAAPIQLRNVQPKHSAPNQM